jgi:hydrogenase expression/formation protein HypC
MCIAFPGMIVSISEENIAVVDIGGTRRTVSLDIIDEEVSSGDYVISHAGFAIHKIDEEDARENLAFLKDILGHETY